MALSDVKALTFDVFGTVVNWRDSIAREANALLGIVGDLAGTCVRKVLHWYAEPRSDGRRHVGGDAGRVARRALPGHQKEIAHIDCGAQHPGRGKLGFDVARHRMCPEIVRVFTLC